MEMLKLKSPYFTPVAQHSPLTNNPEADGALILPCPLSSSVLRFTGIWSYLQLSGKEGRTREH